MPAYGLMGISFCEGDPGRHDAAAATRLSDGRVSGGLKMGAASYLAVRQVCIMWSPRDQTEI